MMLLGGSTTLAVQRALALRSKPRSVDELLCGLRPRVAQDELGELVPGAVDLGAEHPELPVVRAPAAAEVAHEHETLEVEDEIVQLGETGRDCRRHQAASSSAIGVSSAGSTASTGATAGTGAGLTSVTASTAAATSRAVST